MIALADDASYAQDTPGLRVSLQRDPQAPSLARAAVARFTESKLAPAELATLTLLVSELVSNAVLHSDAPPASGILLCARLLGQGAVRVEVIDYGGGFTATPAIPPGWQAATACSWWPRRPTAGVWTARGGRGCGSRSGVRHGASRRAGARHLVASPATPR